VHCINEDPSSIASDFSSFSDQCLCHFLYCYCGETGESFVFRDYSLTGVIEAEKEFMAEMVDSFYKSLKWSIALILKGSTTAFAALKVVLSRNIESIRDFRGDDQAAALELLVEKF